MSYRDSPIGKMSETKQGGGKFIEVRLQPKINITRESNFEKATQLHQQAHQLCFIANSVNFPIICQPSIT